MNRLPVPGVRRRLELLQKAPDCCRRLLAVLVGLLAAVALIASGAPSAAAQTRVGPQPQNLIVTVGSQILAAQTNIRADDLAQLRQASATGVAADSAADETVSGAGESEADSLPEPNASRSQLEAKFKHAADFGITESRSTAGFDAFGKAVDSFVNHASTIRVMGTYRGDPAILNYNSTSSLVVAQSTDGSFISGWQISEAQLQNVIMRGSLGGG